MEPIHVLIAEDEPDVRAALEDLIGSDDAMDVVGTAGDADEAIEVAERVQPDVALVDVKMPNGGGPRATREIRRLCPETHVVAISAYEDRRTVLEMLRAGVVGYIVKGTPAEEILFTIRRSMQGQGSLSVEVTADVIQELAQLLERSESMTRELRQLDRTKRELIQILSHELFTPITAIQGFAVTVSERGDKLSGEEIRTLASGVQRASNRIRRLVGNLAALARLDREGVEAPTRPVEASELIQRASSEFGANAERLRVPDDATLRLWADPELATRALVILIENAAALSDEEAPVEIDVRQREGFVDIGVTDHGPGISEEAQRRVFDAFTQADASSTRTHQGLGIGLYLARRIMNAHGGAIDVASQEGKGSTFRLSFLALDDTSGPEPR
ncbi:MAG: response regulator [Actinomycetota bacterium]